MVFNPYDTEDSKDDPKKEKLRLQAQDQFIAQLQQRIAKQSNQIEELQSQISQLNEIIKRKDLELEGYSKRVEEERMFFEQDKKARTEREHELKKQVQQLELELQKLKQDIPSSHPEPMYQEKTESISDEVLQSSDTSSLNKYIDTLMAYYQKPTNDMFVNSLKNLIIYCSNEGTADQQILGSLLKAEKPLTEEELKQKIRIEPHLISKAIFRLEQNKFIKKVGRGFAVISSEFAEMTDISTNWGGLTENQIYENLLSVVYVESNREELIEAFTKARDSLMEMSSLSTSKRHEMSQLIERLKRQPYTSKELTAIIQKWKEPL